MTDDYAAPDHSTDHRCPDCGDGLKRLYSKKKDRYYWFCQNAQEACGAVFPDDAGRPNTHRTRKDAPDPSVTCPDCGAPMQLVHARTGPFYSCSMYPECRGTVDVTDTGDLAPLCPDDPNHGPMRRRKGRNGAFWSCRCYPDCAATREID
jgi:ssDNA-binding Zn-finger/Zn-ribbon topoisomerase 1